MQRPGVRVLDLCCGTADLLLELRRSTPRVEVLGSDFCHPMLVEAQRKTRARGIGSPFFEADARALPLSGSSFDLITIGFGFRNLANYRQGLDELHPVLKPGGILPTRQFSN